MPPTPRGEVYFHFVGVAVNDHMVVTANHNVALQDIRGAHLVTRRYAVNWQKRLFEQGRGFLLAYATVLAFDFILNQNLRTTFYMIGGFLAARALWNLKKQSASYTFFLTTDMGEIEIAQSDSKAHVQGIANEIERRLIGKAPSAIIRALKYPAKSIVLIPAEPPSLTQPIDYDWAGVTVAQHLVKVGSQVYPVEDILRAEVRKEVKPMLFFMWVGLGMWLAVFACAFFWPAFWAALVPEVLLEFFGFGVIGLANQGMREWTRTHKYTVVMETRYEEIEIASTSRVLGPNALARNINRIVKEHLLITAPAAPQFTTGAPTERV